MKAEFVRVSSDPVQIFVSYAPEDREDLLKLKAHLEQDTRGFLFEVNSELELQPGDAYEEKLPEWLDRAQIILLLVSEPYLESLRADKEVKAALERRGSGQTAVVPVILKPVDWQDEPFGGLSPLPPLGKPVSDWETQDEAFQVIAKSLTELVNSRTVKPVPLSLPKGDDVPSDRQFRTLWLIISSLLLLAILVWLGWYSEAPATAGHTDGRSPTSEYLFNSAVVGLAGMSLIQIARRLFRIRGSFHREALARWLDESAMAELRSRVRTERIADLFDLPSEMLTGQLSAMAEQALEEQSPISMPSPLLQRMAQQSGGPRENIRGKRDASSSEKESDRRTRLALSIQRNLDQFQIETAATWKRYLLLSSILLSMALFAIGLPIFHSGTFIPWLHNPAPEVPERLTNFLGLLAGSILVGLFGGFLGSIARDIVAIVEKLRG